MCLSNSFRETLQVMVIVLFILLLCDGCTDQTRTQKAVPKQKELINTQHYLLPLAIPPLLLTKPVLHPIVKDEGFPDVEDVIYSIKAASRRGDRQKQSHIRRISELMKEEPSQSCFAKEYLFADKDYNKLQLPHHTATFPVNRDRMLTADMYISAVLENAINSQIPGRVVAVIDKDVLSPTMKYVLLPSYTKIICTYEGLSRTGQTRLPLSCLRAIRPDGTSVMLTVSVGDASGKTGLIGKVNNRIWQQYGAAFMIAGISALAQTTNKLIEDGVLNGVTNHLSNQLGQVTTKSLEKNLDLRPIIVVDAGSRIQLMPMVDVIFKQPMVKAISE